LLTRRRGTVGAVIPGGTTILNLRRHSGIVPVTRAIPGRSAVAGGAVFASSGVLVAVVVVLDNRYPDAFLLAATPIAASVRVTTIVVVPTVFLACWWRESPVCAIRPEELRRYRGSRCF
jgi:hypothetical protein